MSTNEEVLAKPEHAKNYTPAVSVLIPTLDGDKASYAKWGHRITTWGRRERRIVANLIAHLNSRGFVIVEVDDGGDEIVKITDNNMKDAMEAAFAVDEAVLRFTAHNQTESNGRYMVWLIFNNGNDGLDVISDHSDGTIFGPAMDDFDAEVWA